MTNAGRILFGSVEYWNKKKLKKSGILVKSYMGGSRMPQVCRIMYEKMKTGDEILHTTPSGSSSTIKIRYYLSK